ncbi:MAG: hypothetical protein UH071_03725 [Paludibacteraceae bacterium]|nr:hypothetical protein [Paludibacteraceae bacterium]
MPISYSSDTESVRKYFLNNNTENTQVSNENIAYNILVDHRHFLQTYLKKI